MRTRPHVSGRFRKQRSFLSFSHQTTHKLPSVWHQKRKFTKTFPRVKIFENPTLTCGRTNTEVFQPRSQGLLVFNMAATRRPRYMSYIIYLLLALHNIWKGCYHTSFHSFSTLRVDAYFFENGEIISRNIRSHVEMSMLDLLII